MSLDFPQIKFNAFFSQSSFLKPSRLQAESAWTQHVPFAFWLIEQVRPKLLVELGVHSGASYFAFCQSVKFNNLGTQCYGVDTWQGDEHSGLYSSDVWLDVNGYNTSQYAPFSYLLRTTFNEALPYFENKTIDLLHIDGLHTYEAVKADFEQWLPKMTQSGVVLFHDIMVRERNFGVYKFWSELKQQYKTFEFYHGYGLGVLALDFVASDLLNAMFQLTDEAEINKIRFVYSRLGTQLSENTATILMQSQLSHLETQLKNLSASFEQLTMQFESIRKQYEDLKKLQQQAGAGCQNAATLPPPALNEAPPAAENETAANAAVQ